MMDLDYTKLAVGDKVAIARTGSWSIMNEGVYTVVKVNKMVVVVRREADGYERTFSVKRRCETSSTNRYRSAFLETVDAQEAREESRKKEREYRQSWADLERAALNRDLAAAKALVAKLESMEM